MVVPLHVIISVPDGFNFIKRRARAVGKNAMGRVHRLTDIDALWTTCMSSFNSDVTDTHESRGIRHRVLKAVLYWLCAVAVALTPGQATLAVPVRSSSAITYHQVQIDGVAIFYREAGSMNAPAVVLLHGYPASLSQYATLIPLLGGRYHVIAPDYPAFGESDAPPPRQYGDSFDHLAQTVSALLEYLNIIHYALYLQDYGGPVGFRIMEMNPERVAALVIQNADSYREGLGKNWEAIGQYWVDPSAHADTIDNFTFLNLTRLRHVVNRPHPERYDPGVWLGKYAFLMRPGERQIQADLLYGYRTNAASYPQ
jgi:pimeloyl-ACP methyl ester carboxylesterase